MFLEHVNDVKVTTEMFLALCLALSHGNPLGSYTQGSARRSLARFGPCGAGAAVGLEMLSGVGAGAEIHQGLALPQFSCR